MEGVGQKDAHVLLADRDDVGVVGRSGDGIGRVQQGLALLIEVVEHVELTQPDFAGLGLVVIGVEADVQTGHFVVLVQANLHIRSITKLK